MITRAREDVCSDYMFQELWPKHQLQELLTTNVFDRYNQWHKATVALDAPQVIGVMQPWLVSPKAKKPVVIVPCHQHHACGGTPQVFQAGADIWVLQRESGVPRDLVSISWVYCFSSKRGDWKLIRRATMQKRLRQYKDMAELV